MAQDLLRHVVPTGDPEQVFERALDLLVEDLLKRKFALTPRPRAGGGARDDSTYIPADVKRAVYIRDRGCCAYVSSDGRRCAARGFLEFHHLDPRGAGGKATVDNISLRCRAHNRYEAELFYGPGRQYGGVSIVREPKSEYRRVRVDTFSFRNETDETDAPNGGRPASASAAQRAPTLVAT